MSQIFQRHWQLWHRLRYRNFGITYRLMDAGTTWSQRQPDWKQFKIHLPSFPRRKEVCPTQDHDPLSRRMSHGRVIPWKRLLSGSAIRRLWRLVH